MPLYLVLCLWVCFADLILISSVLFCLCVLSLVDGFVLWWVDCRGYDPLLLCCSRFLVIIMLAASVFGGIGHVVPIVSALECLLLL